MANAADEARAKAQKARDDQAAAEKEKADKAKAETDAKGGQTAGGDQTEASAQARADGNSPAADAESLDPKALLARLDAQDRLIKTLQAGMAGATGPAPDENKDVTAAGPGAAFDPRLTRPLPAGVTSAPSTQPMPAGNGGGSGIGDITGGTGALWGTDSRGAPVQARTYPGLEEEDIVVVAAGYHDDTIRNPGDIIRGYTGPAASWFVPKSLYDEVGPDEAIRRFKGYIAEDNRRRAA
jgi:hypothetical protein